MSPVSSPLLIAASTSRLALASCAAILVAGAVILVILWLGTRGDFDVYENPSAVDEMNRRLNLDFYEGKGGAHARANMAGYEVPAGLEERLAVDEAEDGGGNLERPLMVTGNVQASTSHPQYFNRITLSPNQSPQTTLGLKSVSSTPPTTATGLEVDLKGYGVGLVVPAEKRKTMRPQPRAKG